MSRDPWFDCPTCNSNLEWNLVFVCWPYYHRVDFLNRIYSLFCVTFEYVRRNRWYRNSITCQRKRKRILMHQLSWCVCRGRAVGTWRGGGDIPPHQFTLYQSGGGGGRCEITPPPDCLTFLRPWKASREDHQKRRTLILSRTFDINHIFNVCSRGCQLDDTEPQPFQKWPQFCKFDAPTGRNK